nr:uncharacterized protein LOC111833194 [Paramormyrops kingsleyae]XP_023646975.1 uncharacterized protein LOC111833194 [Paramormyrops kingsleyae]XP_023646983.1 uncharacterized protein LOC111833194 [Paramormyrops kingsleyae]
MLVTLGASILCCADGLVVTLPEGTRLRCDTRTTGSGQWLVQPVHSQALADIYWGLLEPSLTGILSAYSAWRPWISLLEPYVPPPDPPHVTLSYDRDSTDWYEELFAEQLEGQQWQVASENLYVGPEGVASATLLTSEQLPWFMMGQEAVPHISLALHPKHQAKDLGPMVEQARETEDWVQTQIPQVSFSPSCSTYCIQVAAQDTALLQHEQIARDHGREKMDHPRAAALLASLPDSMWSTSPTDVGLIRLLEKGFTVSKDKLQIARTAVTLRGRVRLGAGTGLSPAHRSAILHYPKPITVKDMLSFLGLTGYSRTYTPDYTGLTQPLRALVREHGLRNLSAPLNWDQASEEAFITLKQRLAQAADLALPDYSLPFHLDVSETGDVVNAILFQKKGEKGEC